MRFFPALALIPAAALLASLAGCNAEGGLVTTNMSGIWAITVPTSDFPPDGRIPDKHAAPSNISPPLSWSPRVNSIVEYVVIVQDYTKGAKAHWIVYGIPAGEPTTLSENAAASPGLVQGKNDFGVIGYSGPDTKDKHQYAFQVFGLFQPLGLPPGSDLKAVVAAMQGKVVAKTRLNGYWP
jgi:Raf kinase inhibitor-like YbhB/YbcL family protein